MPGTPCGTRALPHVRLSPQGVRGKPEGPGGRGAYPCLPQAAALLTPAVGKLPPGPRISTATHWSPAALTSKHPRAGSLGLRFLSGCATVCLDLRQGLDTQVLPGGGLYLAPEAQAATTPSLSQPLGNGAAVGQPVPACSSWG